MSRNHEDWVKAYMQYAAHSEAPDLFHFWTGIATVAGALRRNVWIDQGYFQWTANFYIILVAPPGIVSKSTTAGIGMKLLRQLGDIHFGPEAVTWQSLVQSMADAREQVLMPHDDLYHTMSCITISSSELGTFLNPRDRDMVNVLTRLWDGQVEVFEKGTKTQGNDEIQNPWINIIGCTTPSWIIDNIPPAMVGGGLMSRCIFVYAKDKRQLIAYPEDHIPDNFKKMEEDLVHDLELIGMLRGPMSLAKEAKEWGVGWYQTHYDRIQNEKSIDAVQGYLARKQTHIHKLAMIISAAQSDEKIITLEHLQTAEQILTSVEPTMEYILSLVSNSHEAQKANDLVQVVRRFNKIDYNMLYRLVFTKMSLEEFKEGIAAATKAGYIYLKQEGNALIVYAKREANG